MMQDRSIPMNYYSTLKIVDEAIQQIQGDYIIVSEGANTMDIGRTILNNTKGRQRLDAGSFGTMGVGFGYAIAAQALYPNKKVVMVVGDSAFGFSAMELETAARFSQPLKVIIINNNGITSGSDTIDTSGDPLGINANQLSVHANYEMISQAFGG
jgi:2-hydroxyacyl-CoA lyase 1